MAPTKLDQPFPSRSLPRRAALRTAVIYGVVASGWILASGWLLRLGVASPDALPVWEIGKGLGFVGFTSIVLFVLLQRHQHRERATLETALASMNDAVMISDAEGNLIHLNTAFASFYRFGSLADCPTQLDDYPGLLEVSLADGTTVPVSEWAIPRALRGETAINQTYRLRRKDMGESWVASISLAPIRGADGSIIGTVVTGRDVTQERAYQEELDRIAHHDPLTDLPNRRLLTDRLEQAIALADRSGTAFAVCYLDLDGFKPINDRHGHETGDRFLIEVAAKLRGMLRAHDTVARLGGDEFALLLTQLQQPEESFALLQRVLSRISQPIVIDDITHSVTASLGVTLYPKDAADPDTLLRQADQAMYLAKEAGRNRYQFYDPEQGRAVQALERLHGQLQQALARNELVLHYQPQVDLISREVIGVEALIRWQHPDQGLLPPAAFIPAIEGGALELAVGDWVIASALDQLETWHCQGLKLRLGVNVGPGQLMGPGFAQRLKEQLERRPALKASALELEILESTAFSDFERASQVIDGCRVLGVRFALDDFGAGYSSLAHFRALPVDQLKIDQSFVRDMLHDPGDFGIVEGVVRLAQSFNRAVIAEGVETLEHAALLSSLACRYGQGFGIARPMPAAQLPVWIKDWAAQPPLPLPEEIWGHQDVRLVVATQNYLRWIDAVARLLKDESAPIDPRLGRTQCVFGHWYRGRGFARYGQLAEYEAAGAVHERSHEVADQLLALARDGRPEAARARLHELDALRAELLAAIGSLIRRLREDESRQITEQATEPNGADAADAAP